MYLIIAGHKRPAYGKHNGITNFLSRPPHPLRSSNANPLLLFPPNRSARLSSLASQVKLPDSLRVDRLALAENGLSRHGSEAGRKLPPHRGLASSRTAGAIPQHGNQGLTVPLHGSQAISNL